MKNIIFTTLLLLSGKLLAAQGVYIPPEKIGEQERVVRMTLGDNEKSPIVDLWFSGPTITIFPGDVSYCTHSSDVFGWKKGGTSEVKGKTWLREVIFYIAKNPGEISSSQLTLLEKEPISFLCRVEINNRAFLREVRLRLGQQKRRSIVFFEHDSSSVVDRIKIEDFKNFKYIDLKNGRPTVKNQIVDKPINLDGFKNSGFQIYRKEG